MVDVEVSIQYRDPAGTIKYHSTTVSGIESKYLKESMSDAAEVLRDDGMFVEVSDGHHMFVPPHAIYRADFQVINEPDAQKKP